VDETNAAIGIVRLHLAEARELDAMLGLIQTTCSIWAPISRCRKPRARRNA